MHLTRLTDLLKYWVKEVSYDVVIECDSVVLFRDTRVRDDGHGRAVAGQDLVLLAIDARKTPAVQWFAPLSGVDASGSSSDLSDLYRYDLAAHLAEHDRLSLSVTNPRMDRHTKKWLGIELWTSDEVAEELLRVGCPSSYSMHNVVHEIVTDRPHLLEIVVTSVDADSITLPRRAQTRIPMKAQLDADANDEADYPFARPPVAAPDDPGDDHGDDGLNIGLMHGVADTESDDDAGVFLCGGHGDSGDEAVEEERGCGDGVETEAESDESEDKSPRHVSPEVEADPDVDREEHPPAVAYTVDDFISASLQAASGDVTCSLEPYCSLPRVGRWSDWPKSSPPEGRSVGMKCFIHPNCSATKRRNRITDLQLTTWLFSASPVPAAATADERKALAAEHKAMFKEMCK